MTSGMPRKRRTASSSWRTAMAAASASMTTLPRACVPVLTSSTLKKAGKETTK
jgi:hypothetical protein